MKKTTFRILSAAVIAAGFAFASCDSDAILEKGGQNQSDKSRVIAVSFQNDLTKTELDTDGLTPKFKANDQIRVSNGSAFEDCTVEVNGGVATISTELEGSLTAVYPSTAAKMNESNTNQIDGIQVPTVQDGTFASANICKAEIPADATSATFENQTAVFKITPGAGADTKYVEVIAQKDFDIANEVPAASTFTSLHKIRVNSTSADAVYVSILVPSGLKISNLGFADGFNIKGLKDNTTSVAINNIYTVDNAKWNRPYVEMGGKKWATMNVGATTVAGSPSTSYGDYFAWGETAPYYSAISRTSASAATFTWKDGKSSGYALQSYCGSSSFTEWSPIPYDGTTKCLTSSYDAVTANWGSGWRMPTNEEFAALRNACTGGTGTSSPTTLPATIEAGGIYWVSSTQTSLPEYTGVAGLLFVDQSDTSKRVFFPAAGRVDGTAFDSGGSYGFYWSSSLNAYSPSYARHPYFGSGYVDPSSLSIRRYGYTLRPVSE